MHVPLVLAYIQLRQVVEALNKEVTAFNKSTMPSFDLEQNFLRTYVTGAFSLERFQRPFKKADTASFQHTQMNT